MRGPLILCLRFLTCRPTGRTDGTGEKCYPGTRYNCRQPKGYTRVWEEIITRTECVIIRINTLHTYCDWWLGNLDLHRDNSEELMSVMSVWVTTQSRRNEPSSFDYNLRRLVRVVGCGDVGGDGSFSKTRFVLQRLTIINPSERWFTALGRTKWVIKKKKMYLLLYRRRELFDPRESVK